MSLWSDSFFQNTNKIISGFLPWIFFLPSWGLSVGFLSYDITYLLSPQEAQKASRNPQEATKKIKAEILEIISLVFWKKLSLHKDIIKITDL